MTASAPSTAAPPRVGATDSSTSPTRAATARSLATIMLCAWTAYVVGAVVFVVSGIDIDAATQAGTVPAALGSIASSAPTASVTYVLWILGASLFALAGGVMLRLGDDVASAIAGAASMVGGAVVIVSYIAFLGVLHLASTAPGDGTAATALAWMGTTADWVATILILGVMPVALAASGRGRWAAPWLRTASLAPAAAAAATAVSLVTRTGITTWGFAVVPIGMAFVLVAALQLRARG